MNTQDNSPAADPDRLLTPGEVAALWGVSVKTVSRWALHGWGNPVRTPGGRWRFPESVIRAALPGGRS